MKSLMSTMYGHATRFFHWWLAELASVVRLGSARLLPQWKRDLIAFVGSSSVTLVESGAASDEPLLQIPRPQSASQTSVPIVEEAVAAVLQRRRVRIVIDPDLAFIRRLKLPLAAMPHLASAVQLQVPKLLPLTADRIRSDFRVANVDAQAACVEVELAALRCSDIEPLEATFRFLKLNPRAIHLGRVAERPRFDFGRFDPGLASVAFARSDKVLVASSALLSVAMIATFVTQTFLAQRSLQQALQESSSEAAGILDERQNLITHLETLSTLSIAERSTSAASVLSEVTQRLGHDSWVTNFDLEGEDVHLYGWTADSAAAVAALSSSKLLTQVELRSSQAPGAKAKSERFEITARVKAAT